MVSPAIQCPEYDNLTLGSTFCGTEYCHGGSIFGPKWDNSAQEWRYGISCPCGCADYIYVHGINDDEWELI